MSNSAQNFSIQSYSLSQMQTLAGATPFYVYDREKILNNIKQLRADLQGSVSLYYALKANPMQALVDFMASQVDGFDVASHGELLKAINSGMKTSAICFAGPGKSKLDLRATISAEVVINVESKNELVNIIQLSKNSNKTPKLCLRINPDFSLSRSGVNMTGYASPFGIDVDQLPEIFAILSRENMELYGFHIYSGSQNLNEQALMESHRQIFQLTSDLIEKYQLKIKQLNIGGGFGIPYFSNEKNLDIKVIAKNLSQLISTFKQRFYRLDFILELGRFLIGEAGYYVSQITDIKVSKGKKFLVVDGGMHHHLANSGNFGQVIRKNFPVFLQKKSHQQESHEEESNTESETEIVSVVGPLCTPLDLLAKDVELPCAKIGDYFVVKQSGAYGKSASPEQFLSHPQVNELLL